MKSLPGCLLCVLSLLAPGAGAQAHRKPRPVVKDSAEMKAIFLQDQLDRGNKFSPIKGEPQPVALPGLQIRKNDDEREVRVRGLLDQGALHTGEDFYRAALIFQHALAADDQLQAHLLATIAMAKGDGDALFLVAATLDRYLNTIGKKQVFGTQFKPLPRTDKSEPYTFVQSEIEDDVASDLLRAEFCIAPLAEQRKGPAGQPHVTGIAPCPAAKLARTH